MNNAVRSTATNAVRLIGVTKRYLLGSTMVIGLENVDLEISSGRSLAIIGPSGSGKSTLLNLIGCLDKPTTGKLEVDGHIINDMSDDALSELRSKRIGFVFQNFSLIPVLTVRENVEYPLVLSKVSAASRYKAVEEILSRVGLITEIDRLPNQLSGGQRQRVAIARALVKQPSLLLADEPTANLDTQTGTEILDLMDELRHIYGTTIIIASHDAQLISRTEETITVRDGHVESHRNTGASI